MAQFCPVGPRTKLADAIICCQFLRHRKKFISFIKGIAEAYFFLHLKPSWKNQFVLPLFACATLNSAEEFHGFSKESKQLPILI